MRIFNSIFQLFRIFRNAFYLLHRAFPSPPAPLPQAGEGRINLHLVALAAGLIVQPNSAINCGTISNKSPTIP